MTRLTVVLRDGSEQSLDAADGLNVMEAIRDAGFEEMLALCGGCLSCATCHIYLELSDGAAAVPLSEDEDALLDSSDRREPNSRLSCQIAINASLAGARVTIAPED